MIMPLHHAVSTIRTANSSDAAPLSELARRTFVEAFGDANDPEDLAAFLAATYSAEIQRQELVDPERRCLVAESEGVLTAFALMRLGHRLPCISDPTAVELQRFYVDRTAHGTGLAQRLMQAVFTSAREHGAHSVWLGVWEQNPRALRFYAAQGFTQVGSHVFRVGRDDQTDLVLSRPLITPAPDTATA
jgi:diamine N-acetyltransferase